VHPSTRTLKNPLKTARWKEQKSPNANALAHVVVAPYATTQPPFPATAGKIAATKDLPRPEIKSAPE
jgi:hypothetical protein